MPRNRGASILNWLFPQIVAVGLRDDLPAVVEFHRHQYHSGARVSAKPESRLKISGFRVRAKARPGMTFSI
jgi:hypothetical protein